MWEVIEPGRDTPADVSWIVDGLRNGSLIWTTDGSYDRKKAVDLFLYDVESDGDGVAAAYLTNEMCLSCF
jgi:hypothetical protein